MAQSIESIRRKFQISPSATTSRLGVVDVYTPNISGMIDTAASALTGLAERQIKFQDSKWMNDFEAQSQIYFNEKVNRKIESGEKPDLELFKEESLSYAKGVLKGVPERLSINAEAYLTNLTIDGFENLRKQANKIEYKEGVDGYNKNVDTNLSTIDQHYNNLFTTVTDSPIDFQKSIDEFNADFVSSFLANHTDRYKSIIELSNGALSENDLKEKELELLQVVEGKRVSAVIKSYYQNVDPNDELSLNAASELSETFLRQYYLNEDNVRGVNYNVYGDSSQTVLENIIKSGQGQATLLKGLYSEQSANNKAKAKSNNYDNYKSNVKTLKDLTNPSLFINEEGELLDASDLQFNYPYLTDTQANKLSDLNKSKFELGNVFKKSKIEGIPLATLLNDSSLTQAITDMGGEKNVIKQYFESQINLKDDYDTYNRNADDKELSSLLNLFQDNKVVPPGFGSYVGQVTDNVIADSNPIDLSNSIQNTFRLWDSVTDGGTIDIKGISDDTNALMKKILIERNIGSEYIEIANKFKRNQEISGVDKGVITKGVNNYIEKNAVDLEEAVSVLLKSNRTGYQKVNLKGVSLSGTSEGNASEFAPMIPDNAFIDPNYPLTNVDMAGGDSFFDKNFDPATIMSNIAVFFKSKNVAPEIKNEFNKVYKLELNKITMPDDFKSDEIMEAKSQSAIYSTFRKMQNMGSGFSSFMSPDGDVSFEKMSLQNVFQGTSEKDIKNSMIFYIQDQIEQYEKSEGGMAYLENLGFVNKKGEYEKPNNELINDLINSGAFYAEWNGNGSKDDLDNIGYKIVWNNYEDVLGRESEIMTDPNFSANGESFNVNKITKNYISTDVVIDEIANKSVNTIMSPNAPGFLKDAAKLIWEGHIRGKNLLSKLIPKDKKFRDDEDLDFLSGAVLDRLEEANNDYEIKIAQEFRNKFSGLDSQNSSFNFNIIRNNLGNVISEMPSSLQVNEPQAIDAISYADEEFENYSGFEKGVISEFVYSNPSVDKKKLKKYILSSDITKLKKLISEYDVDSNIRSELFATTFTR